MSTIVLSGFGPHVRFKTKTSGSGGTVKIVTKDTVKTVPLATKVTDLSFRAA